MWLTTSVTNHFSDFLVLFQLYLRRVPHIPAHDGLMIIFQVVALKRNCRIRLFADEVLRRLLLKQLIAFVSFVFQNVKDVVTAERSVIPGFHSDVSQRPDDLFHGLSLKEKGEDPGMDLAAASAGADSELCHEGARSFRWRHDHSIS